MSWIVIAVIVVVVVALIIILSKAKPGGEADYPYRKLDALFTPAERSFLGVLMQVVENDAQVFGKVRVADVLATKKGMTASDRQKAFNKIQSKHFDFILCSRKDLSVLCAIELNDSSHNSKKRKDRDVFLEGACKSAGVPLVQIPAQATYSLSDIRKSISSFLPINQLSKAQLPIKKEPAEQKISSDNKTCPICSAIMVKKVAKKGKNIGSEFWACSSFPKCRHIEPINC